MDRFNDGKYYPLYDEENDYENAMRTKEAREDWMETSYIWNGGNLKGIIDKLDYLNEMGVTAIWLSPVFKQAVYSTSYHGYGIQNFLEIDPHFGNREDLRALVDAAHDRGIYVILDVILNHTGDVFFL